MALIVEDGTGLPNSNTYISLDFANEFITSVGAQFKTNKQGEDLTESQKEIVITNATIFMDAHFLYKGDKFKTSQALEFPRTIDDLNIGVPLNIQRAQAYLCIIENEHGLINTNIGAHDTSNANANRVETSKEIQVGQIREKTTYSSNNTIQNISINKNSTSSVDNTSISYLSQAEALLAPFLQSSNFFKRG